jgi:hypothetical protein
MGLAQCTGLTTERSALRVACSRAKRGSVGGRPWGQAVLMAVMMVVSASSTRCLLRTTWRATWSC